MITPGYQTAKKANTLASNVSGFHLAFCTSQKRLNFTDFPFLLNNPCKFIKSSRGQIKLLCCLSLQLEYKKGHEERVSKYTTFVDPPEVILAKKQGQIVSDVSPSDIVDKLLFFN